MLFSFLIQTNFLYIKKWRKTKLKTASEAESSYLLFWKSIHRSPKLFLLFTDSSFISTLNSKTIRLPFLSEIPAVFCDIRKSRTNKASCKYKSSRQWILTGHFLGCHMLTRNIFSFEIIWSSQKIRLQYGHNKIYACKLIYLHKLYFKLELINVPYIIYMIYILHDLCIHFPYSLTCH